MKNNIIILIAALILSACSKEETKPYIYPDNPQEIIIGDWNSTIFQKWSGLNNVEIFQENTHFMFSESGTYGVSGSEYIFKSGKFKYNVSEHRLWMENNGTKYGCCIKMLDNNSMKIQVPTTEEGTYYLIYLNKKQ